MNGGNSGLARWAAANPDPLHQAAALAMGFGPEALILLITVLWFVWLSWMITKKPKEASRLTDTELHKILSAKEDEK